MYINYMLEEEYFLCNGFLTHDDENQPFYISILQCLNFPSLLLNPTPLFQCQVRLGAGIPRFTSEPYIQYIPPI